MLSAQLCCGPKTALKSLHRNMCTRTQRGCCLLEIRNSVTGSQMIRMERVARVERWFGKPGSRTGPFVCNRPLWVGHFPTFLSFYPQHNHSSIVPCFTDQRREVQKEGLAQGHLGTGARCSQKSHSRPPALRPGSPPFTALTLFVLDLTGKGSFKGASAGLA